MSLRRRPNSWKTHVEHVGCEFTLVENMQIQAKAEPTTFSLERFLQTDELESLALLDLTGCLLGPIRLLQLLRCERLHGLRELHLEGNRLGNSGAAFLADYGLFSSVYFLDLSNNEIGDLGAKALADTASFASLRQLNLSGNPIGKKGMRALSESTTLGGVCSFVFADPSRSNTHVFAKLPASATDTGISYPALQSLEPLHLDSSALASSNERALRNTQNLGRPLIRKESNQLEADDLVELDFLFSPSQEFAGVDWDDGRAVTEVTQMFFEQSGFRFSFHSNGGLIATCQGGRFDLDEFLALDDLDALFRLEFASCTLEPSTLRRLGEAPVMEGLRELSLNGCCLGDMGLVSLLRKSHFPNVSSLDLRNNRIGDVGCIALAQHVFLERLRYLDLRDNSIGKEGLLALAKSSFLQEDTELCLDVLEWSERIREGFQASSHPQLRALAEESASSFCLEEVGGFFLESKEETKSCPECGVICSSEDFECPSCALPLQWLGGEFLAKHLLARGGYGNVYLVEDRTGRELVMKVLAPEIAKQADGRVRFAREAEFLRELQKEPGVVSFVKSGQDSWLGEFFVMEYVKGYTLQELLDERGYLEIPLALQIFREICDIVSRIHQRQIVHRDLKPDNILLRPKHGGYEVILLDFGIAKRVGRIRLSLFGEKEKLTQDLNVIIGSKDYMPLEQWTNREISPQTDVYALGVVLYHMLTGKLPIELQLCLDEEGNPVKLVGFDELKNNQHRSLSEQLPSGTQLQKLDEVLSCAFQKDHKKRWKNVAHFSQAVEEAILD